MDTKDRREFEMYLQQCTDAQVRGVFEKEKTAGRNDYAALAYSEAMRRDIRL